VKGSSLAHVALQAMPASSARLSGLHHGPGHRPEEVAMTTHLNDQRTQESVPARDGAIAGYLKPAGRFVVHLLEMCGVMCLGAIVLSVLFFGAAGLLGYTDLPGRAPELSVLVIAINLSLPMAAWMRFRGMQWRPTLEMSGSTMAVGLLLILAYWLDVVAKGSLVEIQTSLACPLMLAVMLLRFRLYAGHAGHDASTPAGAASPG
jgi:hypothetical protein